MSVAGMITTFTGAFLVVFAVSTVWGKFFSKYDMAGSMIAAGFLIGTMWCLNHGASIGIPGVLNGATGVNLIVQGKDAPWVDMAWAIGAGVFANSIYSGGSVAKAIPTVVSVAAGGLLGGFILSCVGK